MNHSIKRLLLCMVLLSSCAMTAGAASFSSQAAGTTGSDFLNLGVGARPLGMGGAYTAVAEGAEAAYWNPAGLAQVQKMAGTFMRANYVEGITYNYFSYAYRFNQTTVMSASAMMTDIGDIKRTDINGNWNNDYFRPKDAAYYLSYCYSVVDLSDKDHDVAIGVSGKYISSKIVNSATAYGLDIGVMTFHFAKIPYRLGFTVQNLGKGTKYDQDTDPMPLNIKTGGAVSLTDHLLFALDANFPKSADPYATIGAEVEMFSDRNMGVAMRGGYNTQQARIQDGAAGLAFGAGIAFGTFRFDYSFGNMGELGNVHRFSINFDLPTWKPVFKRADRTIFASPE
ncbi:MAG: PorV/PorQ family protein [Elusimicrobia bacterium]|nr:PorV/PorQ family protein [Elusimicrobiota bacterium]